MWFNQCVTTVTLPCLQALVDVLQEGGAPELINLDLRGNTLSDHAQQLLVSLHHHRRCNHWHELPHEFPCAYGNSWQSCLMQGALCSCNASVVPQCCLSRGSLDSCVSQHLTYKLLCRYLLSCSISQMNLTVCLCCSCCCDAAHGVSPDGPA
jgi:hypothetical protein